MGLIKDFREFIGTGNAIDLAVGIIIGSAMTTILKSLVDELVVPLTGLLGKLDLANSYTVLKGTVKEGMPLAEVRKLEGVVALGWGQFLTILVNTMILAFVVFLVVRSINKLRRTQANESLIAHPPAPPADVALLAEIRDLLKTRPV